jgi:hypothetical protein
MLSPETLERYRRMTPAERFRLTMEMTEEHLRDLLKRNPEEVDRWFELIRQENDERNRRMLEAIARSKEQEK